MADELFRKVRRGLSAGGGADTSPDSRQYAYPGPKERGAVLASRGARPCSQKSRAVAAIKGFYGCSIQLGCHKARYW